MSHYEIIKGLPSEIVMKGNKFYWADTDKPVDWEALEKHGYVKSHADPPTLTRGLIREAIDDWDGDALVTKSHADSLVDHLVAWLITGEKP